MEEKEIERKLNVVENDQKLLSGEIKQVLVEIRDAMNDARNPFFDSVYVAAMKHANTKNEAAQNSQNAMARFNENYVPPQSDDDDDDDDGETNNDSFPDILDDPDEDDEITDTTKDDENENHDENKSSVTDNENPSIGTTKRSIDTMPPRTNNSISTEDALNKLNLNIPELTLDDNEVDVVTLTKLMEWTEDTVHAVGGLERLSEILQLYSTTGNLSESLCDVILSIAKMIKVDRRTIAKTRNRIDMNDYVDLIHQLNSILIGDDDDNIGTYEENSEMDFDDITAYPPTSDTIEDTIPMIQSPMYNTNNQQQNKQDDPIMFEQIDIDEKNESQDSTQSSNNNNNESVEDTSNAINKIAMLLENHINNVQTQINQMDERNKQTIANVTQMVENSNKSNSATIKQLNERFDKLSVRQDSIFSDLNNKISNMNKSNQQSIKQIQYEMENLDKQKQQEIEDKNSETQKLIEKMNDQIEKMSDQSNLEEITAQIKNIDKRIDDSFNTVNERIEKAEEESNKKVKDLAAKYNKTTDVNKNLVDTFERIFKNANESISSVSENETDESNPSVENKEPVSEKKDEPNPILKKNVNKQRNNKKDKIVVNKHYPVSEKENEQKEPEEEAQSIDGNQPKTNDDKLSKPVESKSSESPSKKEIKNEPEPSTNKTEQSDNDDGMMKRNIFDK